VAENVSPEAAYVLGMRILLGVLSVALLGATVAATAHLSAPSATGFHPHAVELVLSTLVIFAAITTACVAFRAAIHTRIAVAAGLLLVADGLLVAHLANAWPLACDPFHSQAYVVFLVGAHSATVYGLVRKRLWARWIGLAFGTFGALSTGINAFNFLSVRDDWTWTFFTLFFGSVAVGLNLADPALAEVFVSRSKQATLWRSSDRLVRLTRAAVVANLAAVPMLLVYAWMQPFVPSTASSAVVLAVVLGVGGTLTILRKIAGGLVLAIAGVVLVAQTVVTGMRGAHQPELVAYYAVFWLPAAVLGVACGVLMLWRARALARD